MKQYNGDLVVLTTGSSGFVGRAVSASARRASKERTVSYLASGSTQYTSVEVVPLHRASAIRAIATVRRERPRARLVVLHLAWPGLEQYASSAEGSVPAPSAAWSQYLEWSARLAVAAENAGAWLFGIGSGIEPYALADSPILNEPYLTYARRKAEIRGLFAARTGLRHRWLRLHFAFGPHEPRRRLIPFALRACGEGAVIWVAAPSRRRRWLHVADIADALLYTCGHPAPEDWDIVGPRAVTFDELCAAIETTIGRPLHCRPPDHPPADADCANVVPANPASFMPSGFGGAHYLVLRLRSYRNWLIHDATAAGSTGMEGSQHGRYG